MEREYKYHCVPQQKQRTSGGWYQHYDVYVVFPEVSVRLEGTIQVKYRNRRIETYTGFKSMGVLGSNPEWLYRQQETAVELFREVSKR